LRFLPIQSKKRRLITLRQCLSIAFRLPNRRPTARFTAGGRVRICATFVVGITFERNHRLEGREPSALSLLITFLEAVVAAGAIGFLGSDGRAISSVCGSAFGLPIPLSGS